jgi:glycosyltransferase involved in cell wall biosynthesis
MTKILSVVWYKVLPAQFGGQKGIAQFNDFLSEHFPLTCICSSNNEPSGKENYTIKPVLPSARLQVLYIPAWRKIIRELKKDAYTHVILEHCYYGLLGIYIKKRYHKFLVVHSHNIEYLRFRTLGKPWWPLLYRLEKKTHQAADLSLFKTPADLEFALSEFQLDPGKCILVPFGLVPRKKATEEERIASRKLICGRHMISPAAKIILFMGTLDYEPNAEAVRKIVSGIIPGIRKISSDSFKVIVCGRVVNKKYLDLLALEDKDYCYAGFVDDISNYFNSANVFINPITSGGGIKVKLVEALSYGLPVVSSEQGAEGIDMAATGNQMVTSPDNDITDFCKKIVATWNTPVSIPEAFLEKYQWKKIVSELASRINQLKA